MVHKGYTPLGKLFISSREKGRDGLPHLSVTLNNGIINRDSLGRKTETNIEADSHLLAKKGDIAYNMMRIWQGALGLVKYDGLISPAYVILKPTSFMDSSYAEYLFKSKRLIYLFWAYSYGLTNDRLRLYYKDFAKIQIIVLPIQEQRKIAQILSTWDKAISAAEALISNSQQQKKSLMQQLLTGKKRFAGFEGEWMKVKLGDVTEMNSGGTPKSSIEEYYGGNIPWVSIADMTKYGKRINTTERFLTEKGLDNSAARLYPLGTILYAMYASIGECSIAMVELTSSQAILGIRAKTNLNNLYLYYYLSSLKDKVKLMGQQGTQSNLNAGMVKDFTFKLPSIKEQQKIASVLTAADQEINTLQQKLSHLKQEKKALMQQLITGKLRVKVDQATEAA